MSENKTSMKCQFFPRGLPKKDYFDLASLRIHYALSCIPRPISFYSAKTASLLGLSRVPTSTLIERVSFALLQKKLYAAFGGMIPEMCSA